jgi:hypothetical protein
MKNVLLPIYYYFGHLCQEKNTENERLPDLIMKSRSIYGQRRLQCKCYYYVATSVYPLMKVFRKDF